MGLKSVRRKIWLYTHNLDLDTEHTVEELDEFFEKTVRGNPACESAVWYTLEVEWDEFEQYTPRFHMRFYRYETEMEERKRILDERRMDQERIKRMEEQLKRQEELKKKKESPEYKEYMKLKKKLGL